MYILGYLHTDKPRAIRFSEAEGLGTTGEYFESFGDAVIFLKDVLSRFPIMESYFGIIDTGEHPRHLHDKYGNVINNFVGRR